MNKQNGIKDTNPKILYSYSQLQILEILLSTLFFFLGIAYSTYIGYTIDIPNLILGLLVVIFLSIGMEFLNLIFSDDLELESSLKRRYGNINYKLIFYLVCIAFIGVGCTICIFNFWNGASIFLAGAILLTIFLLTVKPIRLLYSGYGEILRALLITFLTPSFAYSIQSGGKIHQTLVYLCIPLFFVVLAHLYITENRTLSQDIEKYHTTAVMRFGSVLTLRIAIYLIVFSYVFMLLMGISKLPWRFSLRWFLSVPVGLYLIAHLNRILSGKNPNWTLINFLSSSLVMLNLALMVFTLLFV